MLLLSCSSLTLLARNYAKLLHEAKPIPILPNLDYLAVRKPMDVRTRYVNEKWLPFIRAGYADDGGSLMEKSLSVGVGYQPVPAKNLLGVGFNWGDPNESSFPGGLDDQYAIEVFYRINISDQLVVTPDVQLIKNPALNPAESTIWMFGLRARLAF